MECYDCRTPYEKKDLLIELCYRCRWCQQHYPDMPYYVCPPCYHRRVIFVDEKKLICMYCRLGDD